MPMFEFTCKECSRQFEDLVTLAEMEAGEVVCPACGSRRIERGFSTFATSGGDSAGGFSGGGCGSGGCGSGAFT